MPQYLFSKTRVAVEEPYVPATPEEAEQEAAFRDAGAEPTTVPTMKRMYVLGLVDGALPLIVLAGAVSAVWRWKRVVRN